MKKKTAFMKFAGIAAGAVMACGALAGCSGSTGGDSTATTTASGGETTTTAASGTTTASGGTSTGSGNPDAELRYVQAGHTQGTFTTDPGIAY